MKRLFNSSVKYLLLFFLISCLFHYRAFTEGIAIAPNCDALQMNYPVRHLYSSALKDFEFPFWNPYEFAGLPFLGEIQNGALYPLNIVFYFFIPAPYAYNLSYILHFALAGFFTFIYLRLAGIRHLPAFLAGLVFGFSGFFAVNRDHTAIMNSAVYFPLVMYFYEKLRRAPELKYSFLIALTVAVQIFAGSFQICLYTYLVAGFFLIFYTVGDKRGRRAKFLALGVFGIAGGFIIALPQVLPTMELSELSWMQNSRIYRGYIYFSLYRVYLATLPSLIFPGLFGGWGPKEGMQMLVCVLPLVVTLAVAVKEVRANRFVMFWSIVAAVSLLLSLGSDMPLNRLLYHIPVYNIFRAHGRNMLEFTFALSALFAVGLSGIFYDPGKRRVYLKNSLFLIVSMLVLSVALITALPYLPLQGAVEYLGSKDFQRPHVLKELSIRTPAVYTGLIVMSAYLVWILLHLRFPRRATKYLLILLLSAEVFYVSGFHRISGPKLSQAENLCRAEPYGPFVESDQGIYRLANIFKSIYRSNPSANLTCRIGSVNAYDPLCLDKYNDMLNLWLGGFYSHRWDDNVRNNIVLGMLGVKYLKVSKAVGLNMSGIRTTAEMPHSEKIMPLGGWRTLNAERRAEGRYVLRSSSTMGNGEISGNFDFDEGAYGISLKARAPDGASRRLVASLMPVSSNRVREILHVIPDKLKKEFTDFNEVFHIKTPGFFMLGIVSLSGTPVEVKDIRVERLHGYSPLFMGDTPDTGGLVYKKLLDAGEFEVYLNRNYLLRAWSVSELVPVRDFSEVRKRLYFLEINPAHQAMLHEADINHIGQNRFSKGKVFIEKYGLNNVHIRTVFPEKGFMVLSDQYYPGWKAFIDGEETKIYEVNGILRGVVVPQGEHSVVFKYRPYKVIFLMIFSLFLVAGTVVYIVSKR